MAEAKASKENMLAGYDGDREQRAEEDRTSLAGFVSLQIVRYRTDHGLSQRQLAEVLGIAQANLARLEAGDHEPSFATLDRISRRLGLEFQITFTRQGPRTRVA